MSKKRRLSLQDFKRIFIVGVMFLGPLIISNQESIANYLNSFMSPTIVAGLMGLAIYTIEKLIKGEQK